MWPAREKASPFTQVVTPLKMYEYLACGVPLLATPLPACVDHLSDPDWFVAGLDTTLEMTGEERAGLRTHAGRADWKQRIVPVLERLDQSGMRTVP